MTWGPLIGEVTAWAASLGISGVVAAAGAWALFKWLGGKWIEDRFSRELEEFKTEKQFELERLRKDSGREIERLKADLNRFADRAARFHVREYEVLPEAWGLMNKAFGAASNAVAAFQQTPDLDQMTVPQFAAWLDREDLEPYQKDELRQSNNKNQAYLKLQQWRKIGLAETAAIEFQNYIILNEIFIEEELGRKMTDAALDIRKALISRSMSERLSGQPYVAGQTDYWQKSAEEIAAIGPVVSDVKQQIRLRLSNIQLTPNDR